MSFQLIILFQLSACESIIILLNKIADSCALNWKKTCQLEQYKGTYLIPIRGVTCISRPNKTLLNFSNKYFNMTQFLRKSKK